MIVDRCTAFLKVGTNGVVAETNEFCPFLRQQLRRIGGQSVQVAFSRHDAMFTENLAWHILGDLLVVFKLALITG